MLRHSPREAVFWGQAYRELLHQALDLVLLATDRADPDTVSAVILSAPDGRERLADSEWREHSRCLALLDTLRERSGSPGLASLQRYWCETFPGYSRLTRSLLLTYFRATWTAPGAAAPTDARGGSSS
jgi:hypothetical protein